MEKIGVLYTTKCSLLLHAFKERKIAAGVLYFCPLMVSLSLWDFQISEAFWRTKSLNLTAGSDWKEFYENLSCSDVKYWFLLWHRRLLFIDSPFPAKLFYVFFWIWKLLFTPWVHISFWEHHFPLKHFLRAREYAHEVRGHKDSTY